MPLRLRVRPPARAVLLGGGSSSGGTPKERVVEVAAADEIRIGRRAGVDVPLPFATVSGLHARLRGAAGGWVLEDAGSTNGTFVDGERLAPGDRRALRPGQAFHVADIELVLEPDGAPAPGSARPEGTGTVARRLVSDLFAVMHGAEAPALIVENGPAAGRVLRLAEMERPYLVGRAEGCELVLPDEDASREHARLRRRWDGIVVTDLGSKNGLFVAGERVSGERLLHDGDVLRIGATHVRLDDPEDRYLRGIEALPEEVAAVLTVPTEVPVPAGSAAVSPAPAVAAAGVAPAPAIAAAGAAPSAGAAGAAASADGPPLGPRRSEARPAHATPPELGMPREHPRMMPGMHRPGSLAPPRAAAVVALVILFGVAAAALWLVANR